MILTVGYIEGGQGLHIDGMCHMHCMHTSIVSVVSLSSTFLDHFTSVSDSDLKTDHLSTGHN